jgi:transposase
MSKPPVKSVEEKTRVVLAVLRGEVTVAAAARREGVSETTIAKWRDRFLDGGQAAMAVGGRPGSASREQRLEADVEELTSALGEAHMELRLWRKGGLFTRLCGARSGTDRRRHDRDTFL